MKRAIILFAAIGGLIVPIAFTLAGWMLRSFVDGSASALAALHGVQLPLWPMSKLILDDPSGKHWLYLPLAAVLSNALIYAVFGALSASGRMHHAIFVAGIAGAAALIVIAGSGFGVGATGIAVAAAIAIIGLAIHHRARPRAT